MSATDGNEQNALSVRRAGKTYDGQPRYEVIVGGNVVGLIEGYHPTFERGPKNARYVTARWKSKRRYWRTVTASGRTVSWASETIKRACWYFEINNNPQPPDSLANEEGKLTP